MNITLTIPFTKTSRNVLVEIYNIPPKDTITLMWVKKLDEMYKNNK